MDGSMDIRRPFHIIPSPLRWGFMKEEFGLKAVVYLTLT